MAIIEIDGLTKSYRVNKKEGWRRRSEGFPPTASHRQAVRGIDLRVEQGEFVAFLGPTARAKPPR